MVLSIHYVKKWTLNSITKFAKIGIQRILMKPPITAVRRDVGKWQYFKSNLCSVCFGVFSRELNWLRTFTSAAMPYLSYYWFWLWWSSQLSSRTSLSLSNVYIFMLKFREIFLFLCATLVYFAIKKWTKLVHDMRVWYLKIYRFK